MASRRFVDLPAEIRNNIYRHVLCYDGIKPEVKSAQSPWRQRDISTEPYLTSLPPHPFPRSTLANERPSLRMQLDVIAPVRKGFYPGVLPPVPASDVLNLLCACRRIYEEARSIFWVENAFIFSTPDTMHTFLHRISLKSFEMIRTLGLEDTVNAEWLRLRNGSLLGCWFADIRTPPFLQPPPLYGWENKFENFDCLRDHWASDHSDSTELKIRKYMIPCRTTYNWLIRLSTSEVKLIKDSSGATKDGSNDNGMESPPSRSCLDLSEAVKSLS